MTRAVIPGFATTTFGNLPDISDIPSGWQAKFQIVVTGGGVFMRDEFVAQFADADTVQTMENKIRDAARVRAVEMGVQDGATIAVTCMITPRKL